MKARSIGTLIAAVTLSTAAFADETAITVVVPNPSAIANFPVVVAMEQGYFADAGLDVTMQNVNGSASVLQALAAGQGQIGLPGAGPVLAAHERGEDFVFFFNQFPRSIFSVVVPEESTVNTPAELAGLTIGVGTADGSETGFARSILASAGLTEGEDYTFLVVGEGGTAAAAFLNEEVQAYVAGAVDAAIIEARGIDLRDITPIENAGLFGNGWAANADYIEANPEVIAGFGEAIIRAMEFAADPTNFDAVMTNAATANPQELEDIVFATAMLSVFQEKMTPPVEGTPAGYMPPENWEEWHASALESGVLSAPLPDLGAVYTNDFVEGWN